MFHVNCLNWRQFAWNVKSCFLVKNKKISPSLSSAELAQRGVKVNEVKSLCMFIDSNLLNLEKKKKKKKNVS